MYDCNKLKWVGDLGSLKQITSDVFGLERITSDVFGLESGHHREAKLKGLPVQMLT